MEKALSLMTAASSRLPAVIYDYETPTIALFNKLTLQSRLQVTRKHGNAIHASSRSEQSLKSFFADRVSLTNVLQLFAEVASDLYIPYQSPAKVRLEEFVFWHRVPWKLLLWALFRLRTA